VIRQHAVAAVDHVRFRHMAIGADLVQPVLIGMRGWMAACTCRLRLLTGDLQLVAGMRIMACPTPQIVPGSALALTRSEFLDVARDLEVPTVPIPYEISRIARQSFARPEFSHPPTGSLDARVAGKMAPAAD